MDLKPGLYSLHVDASGLIADPGNPDLEYVDFATEIEVGTGEPSIVDASLPIVDTSQNVPVTPDEPIVLAPESIPGLRIEIVAGATTFPDGGTSGEINVVEIGFNDGPAPLPSGFAPAMMIRIIPDGTTFDPPARVTFPNRDDLPAGRSMELFSFDAHAHGWVSDGGATTATESVSGNPGVGITVASTHFVVCDAYTVQGRITDPTGSGIANAHVDLWARVAPFGEGDLVKLHGPSTTTGSDGGFAMAHVRACNITISAHIDTPEAFGEIEPGDTIQSNGSGVMQLAPRVMELVTQTVFSIEGVARRHDGSPIAGAIVQLFDPDGSGTAELPTTSTNTVGAYALLEVTAPPGKELGVYAFGERTQLGGEVKFDVPPLSQSGTTLVIEITLCEDLDFVPCGDWGEWTLVGDTLHITQFETVCGEVVGEDDTVQIISLVEGVLTVEVVEGEQTEHVTFTRVGGTGPSGVSADHLAGIYRAAWDNAYLAMYANGTFGWLKGAGEFGTLQSGTYTVTPSQITATFLESTDESMPVGTHTFDYTVSGDVLTFVDPEGNDTFGRCVHGPDNGVEGNWSNTSGGNFNLVLYRGEFAGIGYHGPQ